MLYVRRLSPASSGRGTYALLFLDMDALTDMLADHDLIHGLCAVTDSAGNMVLSDGRFAPPAYEDGAHYDESAATTYLRVPIGNLGLQAHLSVRDGDIMGQIDRFSVFYRFLLLLFLTMLAALAAMLLTHFVRPLVRLLKTLGRKPLGEGVFLPIAEEIRRLDEQTTSLQRHVAQWEPLLRQSALRKLLRGEVLTDSEREIVRGDFPNPAQNHRAAIIGRVRGARCEGDEELLARRIAQALPTALACPVAPGTLCALVPVREGEEEESRALFAGLLESLNGAREGDADERADAFGICVGLYHAGEEGLRTSFEEATTLLDELRLWKNAALLFAGDERVASFDYRLSYQDLERLQNLLMQGDARGARRELTAISEANFARGGSNRQSRVISHQFYRDILGVLVRVAAQNRLLPLVRDALAYDPGLAHEDMIRQMAETFDSVCEIILSERGKADEALPQTIQRYIVGHFDDPELSLSALAAEFHMTESSFSKYFKAKVGVNFAVCLERLRMGEAEAMLLTQPLSVREIALRVGYANPPTFQKAFKRMHGVSPSEWSAARRARGAGQAGDCAR